jgi:predicted transcriptional regulator
MGGRVTEPVGASSALGSLEAEVMSALWRVAGPLSVRETVERLNTGRSAPLAYTTVMTVMTRLADKGILSRSPGPGRGFVYTPVMADPAEIAVRGVLAEFGEAALARFVDQVEMDPRLRTRLRRLMRRTS